MSCFYLQSKSYPLSHQIENISLAAIIQLTHFIFAGKKQHSLAMFIKLNKKNTLYVNFNKRKREYVIIPYTIGGIPLHLHQNNLTYYSTGKRYSRKNF